VVELLERHEAMAGVVEPAVSACVPYRPRPRATVCPLPPPPPPVSCPDGPVPPQRPCGAVAATHPDAPPHDIVVVPAKWQIRLLWYLTINSGAKGVIMNAVPTVLRIGARYDSTVSVVRVTLKLFNNLAVDEENRVGAPYPPPLLSPQLLFECFPMLASRPISFTRPQGVDRVGYRGK
jgi:hypothetical protein